MSLPAENPYANLEFVVRVIRHTIKAFNRHEVVHRAAAVAFQLTLSVFPGLIFLFSLVPYIPIPNLTDHIMQFFQDNLPAGMYHDTEGFIRDLISKPRANLLSLGFLFTLAAATAGVLELMGTFNRLQQTVERRGFIKQRLFAFWITIMLLASLFISVLVVLVGQLVHNILLQYLTVGHVTQTSNLQEVRDVGKSAALAVWQVLYFVFRYAVSVGVFLLGVSALYFWGPTRRLSTSFFSWGSVTASVVAIVLTHAFSTYISNFGTYNKLYGSIGTMIVFMLWIWLLSIVLLTGFLVNRIIFQIRLKKQMEVAENLVA
jgi:membrane protein